MTRLTPIRALQWSVFVGIGFYLCAVLMILPLPMGYQWVRPQWLLMFVIYCQITNPKSFNPLWAWTIGLLLDSLLGTKLGVHALVFSLLSYITALQVPRFQMRPLWQQVGKIFLLICLGQIFLLWFHVLEGHNPHTLFYWISTLTSCLAWPIFVLTLQYCSRTLSIGGSYSRNL